MDIPTFTLGAELTKEQEAFLDTHGFIKFGSFANADEVEMLRSELKRVESMWIEEKREKAFGIPIKWGKTAEGTPFVNRFAFSSMYSDKIHAFVNDPRWETVRKICGPDFRLGEREKDGVVANHYLNFEGSNYKKLGWHVDGLRDIFYLRLPKRFLNVGLYLDDSPREKGSLRVIPGSHRQSALGFLFGKLHFLDNRPDPREVCIEAAAGDLTLHDGRLWHRVGRAQVTGDASRRRIMYFPFIQGDKQEKDEGSKTPFYHRLQGLVG